MKNLILLSSVLFAFFLCSHFSAQAQATRTWVSGVGDDVNPCSRTAPCKTFAGAISKTAAGGEINIIDAGGFGAVTITKSITIDVSGFTGSTLASGTNGIVINIPDTADAAKTVRIRGLAINGAAPSPGTLGINGIRIVSASRVFIENVTIDSFAKDGISIESAKPVMVSIKNTIIRNIGGSAVGISPSSLSVSLSVDRSSLEGAVSGLSSSAGAKSIIQNSSLTGNTTGLLAEKSEITVINSVIGHNATGIQAGAGSTIWLSGSSVVNNTTGLAAAGGKIISFRNNTISGNGKDGAPTSTAALQ